MLVVISCLLERQSNKQRIQSKRLGRQKLPLETTAHTTTQTKVSSRNDGAHDHADSIVSEFPDLSPCSTKAQNQKTKKPKNIFL